MPKPTYPSLQKGLIFTKCVRCGAKIRKSKKRLSKSLAWGYAYYCDECLEYKQEYNLKHCT